MADPSVIRWHARDDRREKRKNTRDKLRNLSEDHDQFSSDNEEEKTVKEELEVTEEDPGCEYHQLTRSPKAADVDPSSVSQVQEVPEEKTTEKDASSQEEKV
ncbi:hypothetical protein N7499_005499 [Penicillium canescens]|nr:hypothetical protein N7522_009782 [Penicillium canescens]KAJ6080625.1 hypothetical protein N7499_005499 [Penicillium canescens]KAJ6177584.1 hypothetical protein N7485_004498 [Penicillium canescens]